MISPITYNKATLNQEEVKLRLFKKEAINRILSIQMLPQRCNSLTCRWLNDDDFAGCYDLDILQIDHINGDGNVDRKEKKRVGIAFYRYLLTCHETELKKNYQMLCANCHLRKTNIENAFRLAGLSKVKVNNGI